MAATRSPATITAASILSRTATFIATEPLVPPILTNTGAAAMAHSATADATVTPRAEKDPQAQATASTKQTTASLVLI